MLIIYSASLNLFGQNSSKILKLEKALENAQKAKDFKDLIDGDIASSICSLIGGNPVVCGVLSVDKLNANEDEELKKIKSKYEFDNFLKSKGINPEDFYNKLFEERWNSKVQDRLDFLKTPSNPKTGLSKFHDCFVIVTNERGTHCGSSSSISVTWKNNCNEAMDIKFAFQKEDGNWSTGLQSGVKSGEITNGGAWTCKSTGKVLWWARPSEKWMDFKFPKDDEIKANN